MTTPYLPTWATLQEAAEWLKAETGQEWPLPRLVQAGVDMGTWLVPEDDIPTDALEAIFQGHREGFLAPISFTGDRERLAFERNKGTLTYTRRPDGAEVRFTPPIPLSVDDLKFAARSLRLIPAAIKRGARLDDDRKFILRIGPLTLTEHGTGLASCIELRGGLAALDGARIEQLNFEDVTEKAAAHPEPKSVKHSTQTRRRDILTPVIERAQANCQDPNDSSQVWAQLLILARAKHAPLIGVTEEGLQFLTEKGDGIDWFRISHLRKRLKRRASGGR